MHHQLILAVSLLASTGQRHFRLGPWIIVPILVLGALVATPIYVVRDRRRRRTKRH